MASKIEEVFGKNLFHDEVLRERLPAQTYEALQQTIQNGAELELQTADVIADAMMKWRWSAAQRTTHTGFSP